MTMEKQDVKNALAASGERTNTVATSNAKELKTMLDGAWGAPFAEMLGDKATAFKHTILSLVTDSTPAGVALRQCDAKSIIRAAKVSAEMGLSIEPSTSQAAIIPYGGKAQFQIMVNGWLQLAMRTGVVRTINIAKVYEGDIIENNPFTGEIIWNLGNQTREVVVGYAGHIELKYGFKKTLFWTLDEIRAHGAKYSKTYRNPRGQWQTNFDAMAQKTVLKALIKKYCPIDVYGTQLALAMKYDQAIVNDEGAEYADAPDVMDIVGEEVGDEI